ncbi:HEPN domain-containing protein [Candidatus Woesearchaeota archaeon]|nr:HEPN domain-containing protein [Candidatus Woesearchaeota archaeon]
MSLKEKLDKCLKEGERGGERHKGLRKVEPKKEAIGMHVQKAVHNLNAVTDFRNMGYSDWSASASFYAIYHCLLALLLKFGYQSRNQSCTFAFIEDLIKKGKVSLNLDDLKEVFDKDIAEDLAHSEKILDIRESMQYSSKTSLNDEEFNRLLERTKSLFDKLRREIEK